MAGCVALFLIFSIACTIHRNECIQLPGPEMVSSQRGMSFHQDISLEEKMKELSIMLKDVSQQCIEIKRGKNQAPDLVPKMDNSVEDKGRQLYTASASLKEQYKRSHDENSALLGLLADRDGAGLLKFATAAMSSVFSGTAGPLKAIDGNKNSVLYYNSCTHSEESDSAPWWLGVLKERGRVHRIEVNNRGDCCSDRMNSITVEVFETDPRTDPDAEAQLCGKIERDPRHVVYVRCERPLYGKYLRIIKHRQEPLQLCEVEAFGYPVSRKFGMAIQSSELAPANLATDGDKGTCSETRNNRGKESWWQVDILENVTVSGVVITNRDDAEHIFLSDFQVNLYKTLPSACADLRGTLCTHHKGTVGQGETVTLTCNRPMTGHVLRISKKKEGRLSLCDVKLLLVEREPR